MGGGDLVSEGAQGWGRTEARDQLGLGTGVAVSILDKAAVLSRRGSCSPGQGGGSLRPWRDGAETWKGV